VITALVVFAHGSRVESANEAVRTVARDLASAGGYSLVEAAFLELGRPSMEEAADLLIQGGAQRILVLPYFLTLGLHMERDLPRLVEAISLKHKGIPVSVSPPLDGHPALVQILRERADAFL
jgi:sirohydrochlorin ferrochelatase